MEWLKKILEKHKKEDGTIDMEAALKEVNEEFPKNAVPKEKYNDVSDQLKTANTTIKDLKKNNEDNETLQNTIKTHETTINTLKAEATKREKEYSLKGALEKAGATDIDYLLYKLGGVDKLEMDSEGKIKDLDNKIKDLQANNATFFTIADPGEPKPKVLENKLIPGAPSAGGDDVANIFANALNGNFN